MKTQLVITDLTRMYNQNVCFAGYDKDHRCYRPVQPPTGIAESSLVRNGRPIIFPFALVELFLLKPRSQPPHTEDVLFDPSYLEFISQVQDREQVMGWSLFQSVEALFGQPVLTGPGYYVLDCQGPRSLGTIQPACIHAVKYSPAQGEQTWSYRLKFTDQENKAYSLKINDLTWNYYCQHRRSAEKSPADVADQMTRLLQSREVYLRLGLARGWREFPGRCYLQVTGIHTFPDYLEGKTFADFLGEPQ